jgi:hypothetical protein
VEVALCEGEVLGWEVCTETFLSSLFLVSFVLSFRFLEIVQD